MLDRTDFASWQQRIRLYCQGKENGVNILKSINKGPFQMETFWETLAEQPRVYSDLSPEDKERVDRLEDRGTMHGVQVQLVMGEQNRVGNANPGQARQDLALNVDNVFQAEFFMILNVD
ncbi:hypothetical protein Tco_0495986 [Tanacetum coccineum]